MANPNAIGGHSRRSKSDDLIEEMRSEGLSFDEDDNLQDPGPSPEYLRQHSEFNPSECWSEEDYR